MSKTSPAQFFSTYRISIIMAGIALLASGYGYYRSLTINDLDDQITEKQSALNGLKQNQINGVKLGDNITELRAHVEKLSTRIAQAENYTLNLQYIYKIESEAGVKISNIAKADESKTAKTNKPSASFNINLDGSFQAILKFIALAERGPYYGKIISYNLSAATTDKESTDTANATCAITLELYTTATSK